MVTNLLEDVVNLTADQAGHKRSPVLTLGNMLKHVVAGDKLIDGTDRSCKALIDESGNPIGAIPTGFGTATHLGFWTVRRSIFEVASQSIPSWKRILSWAKGNESLRKCRPEVSGLTAGDGN